MRCRTRHVLFLSVLSSGLVPTIAATQDLLQPEPPNFQDDRFADGPRSRQDHINSSQVASYERAVSLCDLGWRALLSGEAATAERYANEALRLSASLNPALLDQGYIVHHSNLILGHVALARGNKDEARSRLIAAGRTRDSATLRSFGPNMSLANALLRQGHVDTVIEFIDLCADFWPQEKLSAWRNEVLAGEMPDFGPNLLYGIPR